MPPLLNHSSLHALLEGTEELCPNGIRLSHFRGIPYATIPRRFVKAQLVDDWQGEKLECSRFGPQCPQNYIDVGYLLRIPSSLDEDQETFEEDEFHCLNINVSLPAEFNTTNGLLPVLIWIHGGSQVVSFPPVAHKASSTTPLMFRSIIKKGPMILVTFNYRLNIFGFGDGTEKNLALKDQRLAIEWVMKHIAGFGGDKDNITLAGESAGAVYAHAHLCIGPPVRRGILQSGSLYLSPPSPIERGDTFISGLLNSIKGRYNTTLQEAPTSVLLELLKDQNINTLWIQLEEDLVGWQQRVNKVEELLIGDVEYESVIWRNGLENASAEEIVAAFDTDSTFSPQLKHLYGISPTRATAARHGALDFINDVFFALPTEDIARTRRSAGKTTYQYLIDQVNPWQSSSRAHHAVDLLFLFGAYDLSFNPAAEIVKNQIQDRWIDFVNGGKPWDGGKRFAFGPYGGVGEVEDSEFAARRRQRHFEVLREMDRATLHTMFAKLAAGRISLLN